MKLLKVCIVSFGLIVSIEGNTQIQDTTKIIHINEVIIRDNQLFNNKE
jgi:hypothetical protein